MSARRTKRCRTGLESAFVFQQQQKSSWSEKFSEDEERLTRDAEDPKFRLWYSEEGKDDGKAPLSDYTLVVESDQTKRTFHVHTPVLSACSKYFAAILDATSEFTETKSNCASFEFPDIAVKNFECILEYAYTKKYEVWGTASIKLCVMLFLSDYFQISILHRQCKQYLRRSISSPEPDAMIFVEFERHIMPMEFYGCNEQLNMPFLRDFLIHWGAHNLGLRQLASAVEKDALRFLEMMDGDMLMEILRHETRNRLSPFWASRVAHFCIHHKSIAVDVLKTIGKEQLLKTFFYQGGSALLSAFQVLFSDQELEGIRSESPLSDLQNCCIEAIHDSIMNSSLDSFDRKN